MQKFLVISIVCILSFFIVLSASNAEYDPVTAPTDFGGYPSRNGTVELYWTPPYGITSQQLLRSGDGVTWTLVADLSSDIDNYHDTTTTGETTYQYKLIVSDGVNTDETAPLSILTDSIAPNPVTNLEVIEGDSGPELFWDISGSENVTGYVIFLSPAPISLDDEGVWDFYIDFLEDPNTNYYADQTSILNVGETYYYSVVAMDDSHNGSVTSISFTPTNNSGQGTTVSVTTDDPMVNVGDLVNVSVFIENAIDLYGASVDITYNPNVLRAIDVFPSTPNVLYPPTDSNALPIYETAIAPQQKGDGENYIWSYIRLRQGDIPGAGSETSPSTGELVTFQFEAIGPGTVDLTVGESDTYPIKVSLGDSEALPISYTGSTDTVDVTVNAVTPVLDSITVTPLNISIEQGETQQLIVTGHYSDGSTQDVTNQVTWSASPDGIVSVSSSGLLTAIAAGSATVNAILGEKSANSSIIVTQPSNGASVILQLQSVTGVRGQTITVPITVLDGSEMAGFEFTLSYNPSIISEVEPVLTKGSLINNDVNWTVSHNIVTPGTLRIIGYNSLAEPLNGEGELLKLTLGIEATAETGTDTNVLFSDPVISNSDGEELQAITIDGAIHIVDRQKGDVTGDNRITVSDVLKVVNFILGKAIPTETEKYAADITNDNRITVSDVLKIVNIILGKNR